MSKNDKETQTCTARNNLLTQTLDEHWPMLQLDPLRGSDQLLCEKIICYQADTGQWIGTLIQMSAFFASAEGQAGNTT